MTTGNISCTSLTVSGAVTTGTVVRPGFATTATAAGTTTLTAASAQIQEFTGTTTQTIVLPDVTTLSTGHPFNFISSTTGALTINSSGGNLVQTVNAGARATITCILASGTSAASWAVGFSLATTAAGAVSTNGASLTAGAISGTTGAFSGGASSTSGNTGSLNNNVATTMFTTSASGLYTISARLVAGQGTPANYSASATVLSDGVASRIVANNATLLALTLSGNAVQVTQTSGGTQATGVNWSYLLQTMN